MTSSAAATGLAGCGGGGEETPMGGTEPGGDGGSGDGSDGDGGDGGDGSSTDDTGTPAGEPVTTEIAHRAAVSWQPGNSNLNPWAEASNMQYWMDYMWWEGVTYPSDGPFMGEAVKWIVDEVEFQNNGCEVLLHFKDGYTWWDGSDVTARDYMTLREISAYQTWGARENWELEFELVDDYTFKEIHTTPQNPSAQRSGYQTPVHTKHSYWKSWLQQYQDAGSQSEIDRITKNLTEEQISMQEMVDEGLGNGFWIPEEWGPTEVTHKKHSGHPRADQTNIETDRWALMSEKQKAIQAFQNDQFDVGESLLPQVNSGSNPNVEVFQNFPQGGVPKLTFNQHNKHLARRHVRQAISYLIDYKELRTVIKSAHGTNYLKHPHAVGMSAPLAKNSMGDDFVGNLIDYGDRAKTDKAAQVLEEGGYSKQGDVWVGPDGDELKGLKYITPPWPIYQTIAKYVGPKLDEFGIKNDVNMPSGSAFWKNWLNNFDFDLVNWWANASHPSAAYTTGSAAGIDNFVGGAGNIQGIIEDRNTPGDCSVNRNEPDYSADHTERLNIPVNAEFPSEVGATDLSGGSQQLRPVKWGNILSQTQDEAEIQEYSRKLGWWYNWYRPHVGLYEEKWTYWGDTTDFNMPDGSKPDHYVAFFENLTRGEITAKTE
ncbi:ABC transporter substrate-binding protein [Halosimplex marinum]|uniref:ABC transporter substrate-binding protein n=1 Tax=Halosimplex marinum TaxID=3396620 RepID=UPI003F578A0D